MAILITGGAGYIGSHTVRALKQQGEQIVILDNLSRGHKESVPEGVPLEVVSLNDSAGINRIFDTYPITSVIHFAAFAYVGESVDNPRMYFENNTFGTFNLLNILAERGVKHFVFSSTCSVYGNPVRVPMAEDQLPDPINPYARSKYIVEQFLQDYSLRYGLNYVVLRYFNAAGASSDGVIGESHDPEPHLLPLILFAAQGKREAIKIYGTDYPTPDGTCIRDYIHVEDLADGHIRALEYLKSGGTPQIINLGTGKGNSVREAIDHAKEVTGLPIKEEHIARRPGDPAILVADNTKARQVLGWTPKYDIRGILETAWKWHQNPRY